MYTEKPQLSSKEEASVNLINAVIRWALRWGCDRKSSGLVELRESLLCKGLATPLARPFEATDDGGLRRFDKNGRHSHVAAIESKRAITVVGEGKCTVPDGVLAQIVGEALALCLSYMSGMDRVCDE